MLMTGSDVVLKTNTAGPIFHLRDESLEVSHVGFLVFKIQYKTTQIYTRKHSC